MDKKEFYSLTDSLKNETELRSEMVSLTELSEALKAKAEELTAETEAVASRATALESQTAALATQVELKLDGAPVDGKAYIQKDGLWQEIDILGTPVGTLAYWPKSTPPAGWLEANGQAIDPALYPDLHAIFGDNLPDLRGEFVRGWDNGRGVDAGRALGSSQSDAIRNIVGQVAFNGGPNTHGLDTYDPSGAFEAAGDPATSKRILTLNTTANPTEVGQRGLYARFDASRVVPTAGENRPRNVAWMPIIKAFAAPTNQGAIDLTTVANRISAIANPNLIINGDFSVSQRTAATSSENNGYSGADRWFFNLTGGAWVRGNATLPNGRKCKTVGARRVSEGSFYAITQAVENGMDRVVGQDLTVSFWVNSTKAGQFQIALYNATDANWVEYDKITGGKDGTNYYEITEINTWQKVEIAFHNIHPAPDKYTQGAHLTIYPLSSLSPMLPDAGDTIWMADVKAEIGSRATPFIPDDPATNLAKCQRYYFQAMNNGTYGIIVNLSYSAGHDGYPTSVHYLPTTMRVSPSITIYAWARSNGRGNAGYLYKIIGSDPKGEQRFYVSSKPDRFTLQPYETVAGAGMYWGYFIADAEL